MKRQTKYVAVAAMAFGTLTFAGCNRDETGRTPGEKVGGAVSSGVDATTRGASSAGQAATKAVGNMSEAVVSAVAPSGSNTLDGVRGTVEGIVEGATKQNEFGSLADHLVKADADRVKAGKPDTSDLNDLAGKFTTLWRDKFSDAFSVMDANKVYSADFLKLSEGTPSATGQKVAGGEIAASHGMPAMKLTFVDENGKWRLDVPDTVDATAMHAKLKDALTGLQDASKWPAEKTEAYRAVTHHILMAVNGG